MRTKNAKRLWPVPVTLGVMALAALLAFGLMATNGAQPAEAQSDDPCFTVTAGTGAADAQTPTFDADANNVDGDDGCDSATSSAVIKLVGQADTETTAVSNFVVYGPGIGGAGTHVYPPGTVYGDHDDDTDTREIFHTGASPDGVKADPLPGMIVQVGPGTVDIGGSTVASTKTFNVAGTAPKTVTLYVAQGTGFTAPVTGTEVPKTGGKDSVALTAGRVADLDIVFLGGPAVGKDGPDDNKDIEDAVMEQCVLATNPSSRRVFDEAADCSAVDPPGDSLGAGGWITSTTVVDKPETRSKLVVRTGEADAVANFGEHTPLFDGKTATHQLDEGEDTVTIYALVEDGAGKRLLGQEVSFSSTTNPSGIVAPRDMSDVVTTERVIVELTGGDTRAPRGQILVDGLQATDTNVDAEEAIEPDDAVASYTLDGLRDDPFNITVVVKVGNLTLGTVEIVRVDEPAVVKAGVFNIACFDKGDEEDYSDATFDDKNDDCDDSGMARRFGAGEMIVVKAHLEDSLGNVVGRSDQLDSELADDFDDPIMTGDPVTIANPVSGKTMPRAWVYTVHKDAMLGDHDITVSTTVKDKDDEDIADVTLTVTVAGPPVAYTVDPMGTHYTTSRRVIVTVTAQDEGGGVPHFTTVDDDKTPEDERNHRVKIDALYGDVRGVEFEGSDEYLELNTDTGMGTFTYTMPRDAKADEKFDILVGKGDMQETVVVVFGEAPPDMTVPGKPMKVKATADGHDTIDVSWDAPDMDGHSPITGYIIERRYAGDMMGDIPSDGYNTAAGGGSFAFSDHMEWWETLNCKGMLAAAGSDADHTMDSDDKTMYCAHYDMTEPTNMAGTITTGDATDMAIQALFEMRYIMDYRTDATATMHSDTDLMAGTKYTYRVSAVNAEGRSMWSDADMATTAANTGPTAGDAIEAVMIAEGATDTRQSTITDHEGDTLTWAATSSDNNIATAEVNDGMVTITGHSAGMATITVTATDEDGSGESVDQTIDVEVLGVLGEASGLRATANIDGSITLRWTAGNHATHHFVYGTDGTGVDVWGFSDGMSEHTVSSTRRGDSLTSGAQYRFWVLSGMFHEQADGTWPGTWAMRGGVFAWAGPATATAN